MCLNPCCQPVMQKPPAENKKFARYCSIPQFPPVMRFGHINSAIRTSHPLLILCKAYQHNIFFLPLIRIQHLELTAFNPFMPWNFTLCTKHPIKIRTFCFYNSLRFIVDQQSRTVCKGTVEFIRIINQHFARHLPPSVKNLVRKNGLALVRFQQTTASRKRTPNVDDIIFELGTDVHRHTIRAIRVRATCKNILHCFHICADFTKEQLVFRT